MDELSVKNYVIIDEFLRPDVYDDVSSFFLKQLPYFSKAGIGALNDNIIRHDIRGDHTYWLDRKRDTNINSFWSLVDETMHIFNRYCFLSLSGYEFHLANYPPGTQYKKHIDQLNSRNNRMITLVIYLNKSWEKGDGGELEIYLEGGHTLVIEPIEARCVMFRSATIPHRVMKSEKNRYSLTGWLLHHPSALGQFFG
jgi:SM-20-related protein